MYKTKSVFLTLSIDLFSHTSLQQLNLYASRFAICSVINCFCKFSTRANYFLLLSYADFSLCRCFNFSACWALTWILEAWKACKALILHAFCQRRYVTFPALVNAQLLLHFCVVFVTSLLHFLQHLFLVVFALFFNDNSVINIIFYVLKHKIFFVFLAILWFNLTIGRYCSAENMICIIINNSYSDVKSLRFFL